MPHAPFNPPELGAQPIPAALLIRAYPPRGRLCQYRLTRRVVFVCTRCAKRTISKLVAELDQDPARRLCNGCYGLLLAADPSGQTITSIRGIAKLAPGGGMGVVAPPSRNRAEVWLWAHGPDASLPIGAYVGKWMPRVHAEEVDAVWGVVAEATEVGRLGPTAKISTRLNNELNPYAAGADVHVICVYTVDCRDQADVRRVLVELRRLGLVGRLSYKEDGATYAQVYGRGAALYVAQPGSIELQQRREPIPIPPEHLGGRRDQPE